MKSHKHYTYKEGETRLETFFTFLPIWITKFTYGGKPWAATGWTRDWRWLETVTVEYECTMLWAGKNVWKAQRFVDANGRQE